MSLFRTDIEDLQKYNLSFDETWQVIDHFEKLIADYFGAKYAVATDSCTHAIELAVRLQDIKEPTVLPRHTYMSVPMMFDKLGIPYTLETIEWQEYYHIDPYSIIDGAVLWKQNSYIPNTFTCLSFQFKKQLPIGRGGMILTDDITAYERLKKMRHDGRDFSKTQFEDDITEIGYHYYMTPEDAARGIDLFYTMKDLPARAVTPRGYADYKDLLEFSLFKEKYNQ